MAGWPRSSNSATFVPRPLSWRPSRVSARGSSSRAGSGTCCSCARCGRSSRAAWTRRRRSGRGRSRWVRRQMPHCPAAVRCAGGIDSLDAAQARRVARPGDQPGRRPPRPARLVVCARRGPGRRRPSRGGARQVEPLVGPDGVSLPHDTTFLSSCALLADTVARLGDAGAARTVYDALAPYARHNSTLPSGGFLGPVARHLGVLAAAYGDAERAREHLAEARRIAERVIWERCSTGSPPTRGRSRRRFPTPRSPWPQPPRRWRVCCAGRTTSGRFPRGTHYPAASRQGPYLPRDAAVPARCRAARVGAGAVRATGATPSSRRPRTGARPTGEGRVPGARGDAGSGDRGGRCVQRLRACRPRSRGARGSGSRAERGDGPGGPRPSSRLRRGEGPPQRHAGDQVRPGPDPRADRDLGRSSTIPCRPACSARTGRASGSRGAGGWRTGDLQESRGVLRRGCRLGIRRLGDGVPPRAEGVERARARTGTPVAAGILPAHAAGHGPCAVGSARSASACSTCGPSPESTPSRRVASGGGSLIYANVLMRRRPRAPSSTRTALPGR